MKFWKCSIIFLNQKKQIIESSHKIMQLFVIPVFHLSYNLNVVERLEYSDENIILHSSLLLPAFLWMIRVNTWPWFNTFWGHMLPIGPEECKCTFAWSLTTWPQMTFDLGICLKPHQQVMGYMLHLKCKFDWNQSKHVEGIAKCYPFIIDNRTTTYDNSWKCTFPSKALSDTKKWVYIWESMCPLYKACH